MFERYLYFHRRFDGYERQPLQELFRSFNAEILSSIFSDSDVIFPWRTVLYGRKERLIYVSKLNRFYFFRLYNERFGKCSRGPISSRCTILYKDCNTEDYWQDAGNTEDFLGVGWINLQQIDVILVEFMDKVYFLMF